MSSHEVFGGLINYYRNFGASGGNYYDLQGTSVAAAAATTTGSATIVTQGHVHASGHSPATAVVATAHGAALPGGQHLVHGNHAGQIVTSAGGTTLQILPAMVVPKIEVKTEALAHPQGQPQQQQQQQQQGQHPQHAHQVAGTGGGGGGGAPIHISGTWKCQFCDKILSSKGNLKAHLHNVHSSPSERGEACPVCAKVFSCKGNLKAHLDNIHSPDTDRRRWTCEFCNKVLSSKGNLKLHITSIHTKGGPSFPCHYCFKVYSSKGNQKAHIENVHRGELSKSGEKSDEWRCVYCSKVLSTKGNLKIHVNTVHAGEGTHACPHCHKTFSSKGNLKTHVENLHGDGKKDWLCSFCQKTLSSKGNLKLHIKNVHKNLDGVISGTSPSQPAASLDLQPHQNEWRCEFCYKILGSKSALKTHINALHANELGLRKAASWTCQICYKALSSKAALLTHIQIVHEKRRDFKCDHCPQTFSSQNLLKTHIKNDHQKNQPQTTQVLTPTSGAEAAAAAAAAAAVAAAQAEHNSQSYYCEFCPRDLYGRPTKLFAHPKDLQGHMYTEHGVTVAVPEPAKDEKCHICPKVFPRREDLQAHLAKDHGYGT